MIFSAKKPVAFKDGCFAAGKEWLFGPRYLVKEREYKSINSPEAIA